MPAVLWRGRSTVDSVLQGVIWSLQEGISKASERISQRGDDETVPDESTLRRWRSWLRSRLVGSALAALGPQLKFSWSDQRDEAAQLEQLRSRLRSPVLLRFRATFGHAILDKPESDLPPNPADSTAYTIADSGIDAPPHALPSGPRLERADSRAHSRDPPRA